MRYIFETKNKELVEELINNEDCYISEGYDPIERLSERVEKMRQAFDEFKKSRGSWRILNYYLRGRGIAQNEIDRVLEGVEEFMSQVQK